MYLYIINFHASMYVYFNIIFVDSIILSSFFYGYIFISMHMHNFVRSRPIFTKCIFLISFFDKYLISYAYLYGFHWFIEVFLIHIFSFNYILTHKFNSFLHYALKDKYIILVIILWLGFLKKYGRLHTSSYGVICVDEWTDV